MSGWKMNNKMLQQMEGNFDDALEIEAQEDFAIEYIDINNIIVNKKNFYEIKDIDELAEDISIRGLCHNIVVRPVENGMYEIVSGERRYTAIKKLVEQGENKYRKIPCKVSKLNDIDSEISLIQANALSRELSDADKLKQVERLTTLYKEKRRRGEKIARIRDKIVEDTGLSDTQIGRYSAISKGLIKELREMIDVGKLTISNASEFATLAEEDQRLILGMLLENYSINKSEANELKSKLKRLEMERNELLNKEKNYVEEIERKKEDIDELNQKIISLKNDEKLRTSETVNEEIKNLESKKELLENESDKLLNEVRDVEKHIEKSVEVINEFKKEKCVNKDNVEPLTEELIEKKVKSKLKVARKSVKEIRSLIETNELSENILEEFEALRNELDMLDEKINKTK